MYAEKDIKEIFSENPVPKPIARKIRWIVFIVIITLTVFMSIDQGILSSTTSEIKEDLKIKNRNYVSKNEYFRYQNLWSSNSKNPFFETTKYMESENKG